MRDFASLYRELDRTTKTNRKIEAIAHYLLHAEPRDAAWAVYFLIGNRLSRFLPPRTLRRWAAERSGIPEWLFEESYQAVGDLAETISLLLPSTQENTAGSLSEWVDSIQANLRAAEEERLSFLDQLWGNTGRDDLFVLAKLITGGMRVGVSRRLVIRALAQAFELPPETIAHRLMGQWKPDAAFFRELTDPDSSDSDLSRPYPFCLAHTLSDPARSGFQVSEFMVEWKWDGIRLQLIRRNGQTLLWSRGEERLEDRFPEIVQAAENLPDGTVLDGELLAWKNGRPMGFIELQRRINRKRVGKKLLQEVPVVVQSFDLLEEQGVDLRQFPLEDRRGRLESILGPLSQAEAAIRLSPLLEVSDNAVLAKKRETARETFAEGLMLKRKDSVYAVGRVRNHWWKWKLEPCTIDAVLLYAQRGHGRRANLYTDYTFALWDGDQLVPFAKAYSGLTDAEIRQVDRFVRDNTRDRFGPVRGVKPQLVMELAFEKIQSSKRHKSGIAVRFPRIVRWRRDKTPEQANTLAQLKDLAGLEALS